MRASDTMRSWLGSALLGLAACSTLFAPEGKLGAQEDVVENDAQSCLAHAIYFEAKDEGREGMAAVGAVVLNRIEHPEFPDAVCAVVKEGGESPPCQFSWWCDGKSDEPEDAELWRLAQDVAADLLKAPPPDPTGGALFFHAKGAETSWQAERERTAEIGEHVFYR